jgi:hypothetical protein
MSSIGAAPRAAVPVSNARAEASRKNGAKSRGPRTLEGKARSAQNALSPYRPPLAPSSISATGDLTSALRLRATPAPDRPAHTWGPFADRPACAGPASGAAADSHPDTQRMLKH